MDQFLKEMFERITDSYVTVQVTSWCRRCNAEAPHIKATSTVPLTHDHVITIECQRCGLSQTRIATHLEN